MEGFGNLHPTKEMKDPRKWDENYLINLPIGEFDWLEVKGRRGLDLTISKVNETNVRENLSKAISAFANSGGGIIIFGLCNPHINWQVDDGGINLKVKTPSTREWLEDIIPTLVDLPLNCFNVYVIQKSGSNSQIAEGQGTRPCVPFLWAAKKMFSSREGRKHFYHKS